MRRGFVFLRIAAVAAVGILAAGCPSGGGSTTPSVTGVLVLPGAATIEKGEDLRFTAEVEGGDGVSQDVVWTIVETGRHSDTVVFPNGMVRIDEEETLETLTVRATAVADGATYGDAVVTVVDPIPVALSVTVTSETRDVEKGGSLRFSAQVEGRNAPSQDVIWTIVETDRHSGTVIDADGLLSVSADENLRLLTVRAESAVTGGVFGTAAAWPHGDHQRNDFWALDFRNMGSRRLSAELLEWSDSVEVWVERGTRFTQAQAREVADAFDDIRGKLVYTYGRRNLSAHGRQFDDILEYANFLARGQDANGRLTILMLDILHPSLLIAGYFDHWDIISGEGNDRDMIYLNIALANVDWEGVLATLAHETVHLITYADGEYLHFSTGQPRSRMDLWLDEMLAESSFRVIFDYNPENRVSWFEDDYAGTISRGNNFFIWDNHRANPLSLLDEYATAFLFSRWLYLQAAAAPSFDQSRLFYRMITSNFHDHRAVATVAADIVPEWSQWEVLLATWLSANLDAANPVFGYVGDDELMERIAVRPFGEPTLRLAQGEGVFSRLVAPFTPPEGSGPNIRYAAVTFGSPDIVFGTADLAGDMLLTFNVNTASLNVQIALTEPAFATGVTPAAAPLAGAARPAAPFPISGWDAFGRNRR